MSSILDYKFYLNFKNTDSFGRIEITEPVGFDGFSFVVEQDEKRFGRDVYKINEEIDLIFYKGNWDSTDTAQQLPNGTLIFSLTQGFDWLIDTLNTHKFESDVDFEIELNSVVFIPSNLDFVTYETDDLTYINLKAVQVQDKQLIKRREDVITDLFSSEDLDGNAVDPIQLQNILIKAKPVTQESEWNLPQTEEFSISGSSVSTISGIYNYTNNVIKFGIDNTLSFFNFNVGGEDADTYAYIEAEDDISNGTITIDIDLSIQRLGDIINNMNFGVVRMRYYVGSSISSGGSEATNIFSVDISDASTAEQIFNGVGFDYIWNVQDTFTIENISIPSGQRLWIFFETAYQFTFPTLIITRFNSNTINAKVTSTAIDSVIPGARYIDVLKASINRINGFEVDASRFDVGGEFYDQFYFTGNIIKGRAESFPVKWKELSNDLQEFNCDYQITDKIYIGNYADFYPNNEIGAFLTSPDATFTRTTNQRFAINEFNFKYKTFEQDREEENTTDAIHTESQNITSNKQVENKKDIEINHIRDAYKWESTRVLGLKETTSTNDDDKGYIIDVVPLAPNALGGFTALLQHNIDSNGNLQILANQRFTWTSLGIQVGNNFEIVTTPNAGVYNILELSDTLILLDGSPSQSGGFFTEVAYFYTNVLFTNRTNEGLVFAENLLNSDNFSNLKYSIKRNINRWSSYINTASISETGEFKNTYFKDNGECTTRFDDESENVIEDADIPNSSLDDPILTTDEYSTRLLVPFNDMGTVLDAINTVNTDKTISGLIRCVDTNDKVIKLYPKSLEYLPSTETLNLVGEQRFESDTLTIVVSSSTWIINEVGYTEDQLSDPIFEFDGNYLKIYDANGLPIINPTKFDKVEVDGLTFGSAIDLMNYLSNV